MTNEERLRELLKNAEKFDGLADIKRRIANREQRRKERKEKLKELMTNETKQTAVDIMFYRAISVLPMGSIDARQKLKETYLQAKEMEKEQIANGQMDMFHFLNNLAFGMQYLEKREVAEEFAKHYYNETYGGNK